MKRDRSGGLVEPLPPADEGSSGRLHLIWIFTKATPAIRLNLRSDLAHPVAGIQACDLVGFGKCRIVERVFNEIFDRALQVQDRLADMDKLGRAFADNVHAEQAAGLQRENQLQKPGIEPHDMAARCLAKPGNSAFIGNAAFLDLFLRQAAGGDFRNGVDAVGEEFWRFLGDRPDGDARCDAALFHRGGGKARKPTTSPAA